MPCGRDRAHRVHSASRSPHFHLLLYTQRVKKPNGAGFFAAGLHLDANLSFRLHGFASRKKFLRNALPNPLSAGADDVSSSKSTIQRRKRAGAIRAIARPDTSPAAHRCKAREISRRPLHFARQSRIIKPASRRNDGMADVTDSKSVGGDTVWVQVPLPAPSRGILVPMKMLAYCGGRFYLRAKSGRIRRLYGPGIVNSIASRLLADV